MFGSAEEVSSPLHKQHLKSLLTKDLNPVVVLDV